MNIFIFTDFFHNCVEWDCFKSGKSGLTTEYFLGSEGFVS